MARRERQLKNHAAEADMFRLRALVGFVVVVLVMLHLLGCGGWL